MENLFRQRATEFLRDEAAFLAVVSPEAIRHYLSKAGQSSALYDRLIQICGTPGSGKTTIGRLFEYPVITALLRNSNFESHASILTTLGECGAIADEAPRVLGCRLALETDYRDVWEFSYSSDLKSALTFALVQARAVLAWLRHLEAAGVALADVRIRCRPGAETALETIGGSTGPGVRARAQGVERALYKVIGALLPPAETALDPTVTDSYRPFDVIDRIAIEQTRERAIPHELLLIPLVILDDAHALHPEQFGSLRRRLARRETQIARWLMTRLDILNTREAMNAITEERLHPNPVPGLDQDRDMRVITLQSSSDERRQSRTAFRKIARDMADRYLRQMDLFISRNLATLADLLETSPGSVSETNCQDLQKRVNAAQARLGVSDAARRAMEVDVSEYRLRGQVPGEDVQLAMLSVAMHRYAKRAGQRSTLFSTADDNKNPKVAVDIDVYDGAALHLLHQYQRPYYYGIDAVCDASGENAEVFLRLCAELVDAIAANIIRSKPPSLDARAQHKILVNTAQLAVKRWDYPRCDEVRELVGWIAGLCLEQSLSGNAWLGAGANAYGLPQEEFDALPQGQPDLARVLQFAVAYNAVIVVPQYNCQGEVWTLLELGGLVKLRYQLALKRGGFIKGTTKALVVSIRGTT